MPMDTRSVRWGIEEDAIIDNEVKLLGGTRSDGVRRLLQRGGSMPEPVYLVAQISHAEELRLYVEQCEKWYQHWASVHSLLRAALPPNATDETKALVATAKEQIKLLQPQALQMGALAAALAKKMTGVSSEEVTKMQRCKKKLIEVIAYNKVRIAEGIAEPELPEQLEGQKLILEVIKSLGI
jgi:hypothetical protein